MTKVALFDGLVVDELDNKVGVAYVGNEPCYVVNDAGFLRHIPAEKVDQQVIQYFGEIIKGSEDQISEQTAKMIGQDDIFSMAMIAAQLKNLDKHFETLSNTGIPEEARAYLGMMGFKIHINIHGEVLQVEQPGMIDPDNE
jgi:hypothetical protein